MRNNESMECSVSARLTNKDFKKIMVEAGKYGSLSAYTRHLLGFETETGSKKDRNRSKLWNKDKDVIMVVRVSTIEKQEIFKMAREKEMNVSEYIRYILGISTEGDINI